MKLIATMPVRNEAWVLALSARVALTWCDEICIGNHASTDQTGDILGDLQADYPGRVHVVSFPEDRWNEMQHRETLLEMARNHKATHIAIVDADEILAGTMTPTVMRMYVDNMPGDILQLPLYNLRGSIDRYHVNGIWGQRIVSVAFPDDPRKYWWKQTRGDEYQHHQREPRGMLLVPTRPIAQGHGGIMHLWAHSQRRVVAKHKMYKIRERIEYPSKPVADIDNMYSLAIYGREPHDTPDTWKFADVPKSWWEPYAQWMKYLDLEAVPVQEKWCEEMIERYGRHYFQGLDLFDGM